MSRIFQIPGAPRGCCLRVAAQAISDTIYWVRTHIFLNNDKRTHKIKSAAVQGKALRTAGLSREPHGALGNLIVTCLARKLQLFPLVNARLVNHPFLWRPGKATA